MLFLALLAPLAAPAPSAVPVLDVTAFGAVGDGVADDTAAFERALAAGAEQRLPVHLPHRGYRLTRPLILERQLLVGQVAGGWPADTMPLPTLIVDHTAGPAITLGDGASLHGFAIAFDLEASRRERPAAVSLRGNGTSISSLRLQYPYDGIVTHPEGYPGRCNLRDIFIVSPAHDGVQITRTYDVPTLVNIEVWCNVGMSTGAGFRFGRNDLLRATDCFAFGCQEGFVFETDPLPERGGRTYGTLTNCATDFCSLGYVIRSAAQINLVGAELWNHHDGVRVDHPEARVRLTGCSLQSNGAPALNVVRAAAALANGCSFGRAMDNGELWSIDVAACDSFTLADCQIGPRGPGLRLGAGVRRAIVRGNLFEESAFPKLRLETAPDARVLIEANLTGDEP